MNAIFFLTPMLARSTRCSFNLSNTVASCGRCKHTLPTPPVLQTAQHRWSSTVERPQQDYYVGPQEGTAPEHNCYILLHTNQPPGEFPMKKTTRISSELQARAIQWKGLVNFVWRDSFSTRRIHDDAPSATVYSMTGGRLELPRVSLDNMTEVQQTITAYLQGPITKETADEAHIYVCTHGERDCRCGSMGKSVAGALEDELAKRLAQDPSGPFSRIKIGQIGHIGGHKHAANVLVFPHGEWLGQLRPEDAPFILDRLTCASFSPTLHQKIPDWGNHWRGRMGLSKNEQKDLWKTYLNARIFGLLCGSIPRPI